VKHLGDRAVANGAVDALFSLTDWGEKRSRDVGGGAGAREQRGQSGRDAAAPVGVSHADGGEFADPAMRGRAFSTAHGAAGGDIEGLGYQSAALNGAAEAGDIVVGGLVLAVGLAQRFCDLA